MIQEISTKKEWDSLISKFEDQDFYHSFDYHDIARGNGTPVLLKYVEENRVIVLPLLVRKIYDTGFSDATCVYGYPGPLTMNISEDYDNTDFHKDLLEYFQDNKIISVFSRLNPYIASQKTVLNEIGLISIIGPIVYIDLRKSLDVQLKSYHKRIRSHINKARRHCKVVRAIDDEHYKKFISIYRENMDRVGADPEYYFSDTYYEKISNSPSFDTCTLLAVDKESGEAIAGSMFISTGDKVHYHLSGTRTEHLPMMPTKLLIDEMRIIATNANKTLINLGGGLGGKMDSLFNFKSSFSKEYIDFCVWKLIVDRDAYEHLSSHKNDAIKTGYFPEYRFNDK